MSAPSKTRPARRAAPQLGLKIAPLLAELAKKSGAMDPALAGNWAQIVGKDLARICRPVRIRQIGRARTLEVSVTGGAHAMQLQYRLDELREKVNAYLGKHNISRISIRQSGTAQAAQPARTSRQAPAYSQIAAPKAPSTPAEKTDLPAALARMKLLVARGKKHRR